MYNYEETDYEAYHRLKKKYKGKSPPKPREIICTKLLKPEEVAQEALRFLNA